MPNAIILGCGMVGSIMAADLARDDDFSVTVIDTRADALQRVADRLGSRVRTMHADLGDPANIARIIEPADIVLGALASRIGFQTLRAVIDAGRDYVDISFMPEDAWTLDEYARQRGVTAVVDCGVAPGMSNLMAGHGVRQLDECREITIYVGGLPVERRLPYQYKAGFSPYDVIQEYTRPARIVEHGQMVIREALSEPEIIDFDGIGSLEAFNTDGLRSLAATLDVPFMKEKTLRYPGHIDLMRAFRETGLFREDAITLRTADGATAAVRPIDVISTLMFPKWTYEEGEHDLTVMRVEVAGSRAGTPTRLRWDLLDYYDPTERATSMSRTTAFPATIIARRIARGDLKRPGVHPPEKLADIDGLLDHVLAELALRGIHYDVRVD
ncbi:MAG: saccharopine dehydrogenase NADP-binding domain-containing protein [Phycisphaerales bacterium]|nr:saccharopine dehydrogenase NADP-binding domain-containing protein [Phycisphaerales bacterium]